MRGAAIGLAMASSLAGCSPRQGAGAPDRPRRGAEVANLFDAATIYDRMGLFATGAPLPMVATIHYLAGRSADSTLAVFALSLANQALTFRRQDNEFLAEYHVEVVFRADSAAPVQLVSDQSVRVRRFQETLRADESVLFQGFLTLAPGPYTASVAIRDRHSPGFARRERADTVPRFAPGSLARPIPIYEASARAGTAERPNLLVNPRATLPYGADSLRFYVEGYGLPTGTRLAAEAVDQNDLVLWRDTVTLRDSAGVAQGIVRLAATQLPVGEEALRIETLDHEIQTRTPFLVTFSSQWIITDYADMLSLLRYFDRQDLVRKLRTALPEQRAPAWREFWTETDSVPLTPENEALDEYLRQVQIANFRFLEAGEPGWLTDRGMVFITLGAPDLVQDFSGGTMSRGGTQTVRWTYNRLRLVLLFQDLYGFGRLKLTPNSRAEYQQALARVHR